MTSHRTLLLFPGEEEPSADNVDELYRISVEHRALIYLTELRQEADVALLNIERLREQARFWSSDYEMEGLADDPGKRERVRRHLAARSEVYSLIEAILTAWARMSLLLFPAPPSGKKKADIKARAETRAKYLRGLLAVPENHLLSNRELRNRWMHFDEYLDLALSQPGYRWRGNWGLSRDTTPVSQAKTIRTIEVDTLTVHFLGDTYSVDELEIAVLDLRRRLDKPSNSAD